MSKLSDRLAERKAELNDVSVRAVSDRAKADGHKLSQNTVAKYLHADHPQPTPATLDALAAGFRLPPSELYRLADVQQSGPPFEPHKSADLLTAPQRNAVNEIIRLLAAGNEGNRNDTAPPAAQESGAPGEADESQKTPAPPLDRLGVDLAAMTGERALDREDEAARRRGEEPQD